MNTELLPTLTAEETAVRAKLEAIVHRFETHFVSVGSALAELLDSKLYRSTHATFEAYCEATFKFSRSRVYRLLNFGKVLKQLADNQGDENVALGDKLPPEITERDVRELEKLPKKERSKVIKEAASKAPTGKGLGKAVRQAVEDRLPKGGVCADALRRQAGEAMVDTVTASAYTSSPAKPDPDPTIHPVIQAILDHYTKNSTAYNELPVKIPPRQVIDRIIAVIEPLLK